MSKKTKIVLDTDMGADDAWCLITLLHFEEKFNIELQAITIVPGNTSASHAAQNTLLLLEKLKRTDIKVYLGATDSLLRKKDYQSNFHGEDGFQDLIKPHDKPSLDLIQKVHAVEALKFLIEENENELVVFSIGPLTNLALLFKMYPDISKKIKALHVMGGNYLGVGNVTKSAEFNFWYDPEAAHIVIDEAKCPLYIMPWETTLKASEAMPHAGFRFGLLNSIPNDFLKLMDLIEENSHYRNNFLPCDAFLIACYFFPQMIKQMKHHNVSVELNGKETRGQMLLDHRRTEKPNASNKVIWAGNAHVIEEVDAEFFKKVLLSVCGHKTEDF